MTYEQMSDEELRKRAAQGDTGAIIELERRNSKTGNGGSIGGVAGVLVFGGLAGIWLGILRSIPRGFQPYFGYGTLILIAWLISRYTKNRGCLIMAVVLSGVAFVDHLFEPPSSPSIINAPWNGVKGKPIELAKIPWQHVENSRQLIHEFLFITDKYRQRPRSKDEPQWQRIMSSMKDFSDSHSVSQLISTKYANDAEVRDAQHAIEQAAAASNDSGEYSPEVMKRIHKETGEAYQIALQGYVCWKEGWRP